MKRIRKSYITCVAVIIGFLMACTAAVAQSALSAYTGIYKRNVNGYSAYVEISIKNNKLAAKQSWDGKTRRFDNLGNDKFIITMDGWAIKFIRDKHNKVIQMQVLADEVWTKI